jgi:uncharacterized membrane protein YdjX (TVP38/TMEM64 family)
MKRWVMISTYLLAAGFLLLNRSAISEWLKADGSWSHDLSVLLIAFAIALVPAIPFTIVAVLFGAKFGPIVGTILNLGISVAAAVILFLLVRYTFSPEQRGKAAGIKGFARLTVWMERNPFMAVLFARMLPIAPAQVVNIYSALTRMRFVPYFAATILGKIPFIMTMTLLGHQLLQYKQWSEIALLVIGYGLFLLIVGFVYKLLPY